MKIIHVINNSTFTEPFIKFINSNFNKSEHVFLVIGKKNKFNIKKEENVFFIKNIKDILSFIKNVKNSDKIIFHGLFGKKIILFLFVFRNILKKSYWLIWGGDLYYFRNRKKNFKSNIYEFLRKKAIKNFENIITLVSGDYELAKKWYKTKAEFYEAFYPNPVNYKFLDTIEIIKSDKIVIQVGNSADPSNNHKEILDNLKKYKNKNIEIICPLSYGDKEYAKYIKEYGFEIYGEKFIPLIDFLAPEEYSKILSKVDIAIFNHDRQQGVNNILALLYLEKKVYIRKDVTTWETMQNKNLKIYNTYNLKNESFEMFSTFKDIYKIKNKEIIKEEFSEERCIELWEKIFNS